MQNAIGALWTELVDAATDMVQAILERLRPVPTITLILDDQNVVRTESGELIEQVAGGLAGSNCRLGLSRDWFFRASLNPVPLESLPFLDAFARQQIDRVTPWYQSDVYVAVTHKPLPDEPNRLLPVLTVVPKILVSPHVAMLESRNCSAISFYSTAGGEHLEISIGGSNARPHFRRYVSIGLAFLLVVLPSLAGFCWWQAVAAQAGADQVYEQLTKRREALIEANSSSNERGAAQTDALKPHVAFVLEDLAAALPDTAYLTRLSIEKDRVSISGIALDPPELVPILEKTGRFSEVTFSDATTKSQTGASSHFSLEMRIEGEKKASPE